MPQLLPFTLHGEKCTALIEEQVDDMMTRLPERAEQVYPDLILPGMKKLPARQRLARYVALINPIDADIVRNPDYLKMRKEGLVPEPVSPFLLNALATPDVFREITSDFRQLIKGAEEKVG